MPFCPVARLNAGDRLTIVAPAGPFERAVFEKGVTQLPPGAQVAFSPRIFEAQRYLAGADDARLAELQAALDDDSCRAIVAARGGYGTTRLLPRLELTGRTPKALVGFSDLTALHAAAQVAGWRSLHAPVITQLGIQPHDVVERLHAWLAGTPVAPLTGAGCLVPGVVEGPLLGGNLSVFSRLLGTPYLPPLDGAVLLLEDVGERPYRIDRMWTHLAQAGVFAKVRGIVLGDFTGCEEKDADYGSLDVLTSLARETGLPCAHGFPIGHGVINQPVALGAGVRLDAQAATLTFLEPLVGA